MSSRNRLAVPTGARELFGDPARALPLIATLRLGVGAVMTAAPTSLPSGLGGDRATAAQARWLTRMVGARELALGAGTALASRGGGGRRPWLVAQMVADVGDAAVLAHAGRTGQIGRWRAAAVAAAALAAVGWEVALARRT